VSLLKKLLAAVCLVLGVSGVFAAFAPSASAQTICVDLYVRIGETKVLDHVRPCI
jgi:hypothetical protein